MSALIQRLLGAAARVVLRVAGRTAPAPHRDRWSEIWRAELDVHDRRLSSGADGSSAGAGLEVLRHALGVLSHAAWLRTRGWTPDALLQDLRYGGRSLRRRPGFTLAAWLVLTLGIGATTTIFTVADDLLLRPLPGVREPERLVEIWRTRDGVGYDNWSHPNYRDLGRADGLTGAVAYANASFSLEGDLMVERIAGQLVSREYFAVLGVRAAAGRLFGVGDERAGAAGTADVGSDVAVISHRFWRDRYGASPAAIGSTLRLNGQPLTVVGVASPGFAGVDRAAAPRIWVPVELDGRLDGSRHGSRLEDRYNSWLFVVARLRPGVSLEAAQAAVSLQLRRLHGAYALPDGTAVRVTTARGLDPAESGQAASALVGLLALVGVLLLIACANVATLLLAQARGRRGEYGIRLALGAGRGRLIRQLLVEGMLLSTAAALGGALLSGWSGGLLVRLFERLHGVSLSAEPLPDVRVLAFSVGLAVASVLLFGLAPAFLSFRTDVARSLGDRGGGVARGWHRFSDLLVASQIGLAIVALIVAGLFVRSLYVVTHIEPGFDAERLAAVTVTLDPARQAGPDVATDRFLSLAEAMAALPGVASTTLTDAVPVADPGGRRGIVGGAVEQPLEVSYQVVGPRYFETVGIPLLRGRRFGPADRAGGVPVALVNRALASRLWPDGPGIGRRIAVGAVETEVVGVVADTKVRDLREAARPHLYLSLEQEPAAPVTVLARTDLDPAGLLASWHREIPRLDPGIRVHRMAPVGALLANSYGGSVLLTRLIGAVGTIALMLATVGAHGVVAFLVSERRREMAVRMALGARPRRLVGRTVGRAVAVAAVGVVAGGLAARTLTPALKAQIHGVAPDDPATFLVAAAVLLTSVALAALLPARRAVQLDVRTVLRSE